VATSVRITAQIEIPRSELRFSFVRSSGPGGQNVNKVASKAVLRWGVARSLSISDGVRERFLSRFRRRINDRGELIIASQRYRDQAKNIDDCLAKLREMLLAVVTLPIPRKKSKVPKAARAARLQQKKITAAKKRRRKLPPSE
jgi:ribosome-associated protein